MPHLCVEEHASLSGRGSFVAKLERMRSFLEDARACNESHATEAAHMDAIDAMHGNAQAIQRSAVRWKALQRERCVYGLVR